MGCSAENRCSDCGYCVECYPHGECDDCGYCDHVCICDEGIEMDDHPVKKDDTEYWQ